MARNLPKRIKAAATKNALLRTTILDQKAGELADIFLGAQDTLLQVLLGEVAGPRITPSRVANLSAEIDRIIQTELTAPSVDWIDQNVPQIYNQGITQGARTLTAQTAADVFDAIPQEVVKQTYLTFTEGADYEGILGEGFKTWLGEINRTSTEMLESIRKTLTEGSILGLSNKDIVGNLLDQGQLKPLILPDGRKISAETRARAIVRTEGNRAMVQAEVAVNRASGLDAYIDLGVKDEVTSGICRVAQRQIPHTLGWWQSSPLGVPPRHIANCRDELMAVFIDEFSVADARALGVRGYDPATFELDSGKATGAEIRRLENEIRQAEASQTRGRHGVGVR